MPIDFSKLKSRSSIVADAKKDLETPRSGGMMASSILDLSKAPYPVESWKTTKARRDWEIDILAIPTENPNSPMVRSGLTAVGEWHFHLRVDVHQFLAGTTNDVVCLKQFGRKCPACDEFFKFHDEHNKGLAKDDRRRKKNPYSVSTRSYMLVRPRTENPEGKIFLYNASGATGEFVDSLLAKATSTRNGSAPVDFAHPENGSVVMFDTVEKQGGKALYYPATNFDFRPRPKEEGLELWKKTFALDSLLKVHTEEEIEDIMYNGPGSQPSETTQDTQSQASRSTYHQEEADAPDTQETRTQHPAQPENPAEDGKWKAPETAKPEAPKNDATGNRCPHGLKFGKSLTETPEPLECRNCDKVNPKAFEECASAA